MVGISGSSTDGRWPSFALRCVSPGACLPPSLSTVLLRFPSACCLGVIPAAGTRQPAAHTAATPRKTRHMSSSTACTVATRFWAAALRLWRERAGLAWTLSPCLKIAAFGRPPAVLEHGPGRARPRLAYLDALRASTISAIWLARCRRAFDRTAAPPHSAILAILEAGLARRVRPPTTHPPPERVRPGPPRGRGSRACTTRFQ